jgi:hypothetical protein
VVPCLDNWKDLLSDGPPGTAVIPISFECHEMGAWLSRLVVAGVAIAVAPAALADNPTFSDLLARAEAQAAAGHRWAPAGDNMTETVSVMMEIISTATPEQVAELSALLESDSSRLPHATDGSPPRAEAVPTPQAIEAATTREPGRAAPRSVVPAVTTDPDRPVAPSVLPTVTMEPARLVPPSVVTAVTREPDRPVSPPVVTAVTTEPDRPVSPIVPAMTPELDRPVPAPIVPAMTTEPNRPVPPPIVPAVTTEPNRPVSPPGVPAVTAEPSRTVARPAVSEPTLEPARPVLRPGAPATAMERDRPVAKPAAAKLAHPGPRAAELFARGQEAERLGDVSGARRFYASAVQQGSATAARNLGRLYDPVYLQREALGGLDPDLALARHWYERAVAMGDAEAGPLLEALALR